MDDFISREAALDAVDVCNLHRGIIDALQSIISDIPTADVVEVVRCKDCTYYNKDSWLCENRYGLSFANADKYCSMGVRREPND